MSLQALGMSLSQQGGFAIGFEMLQQSPKRYCSWEHFKMKIDFGALLTCQNTMIVHKAMQFYQ